MWRAAHKLDAEPPGAIGSGMKRGRRAIGARGKRRGVTKVLSLRARSQRGFSVAIQSVLTRYCDCTRCVSVCFVTKKGERGRAS